MLLNIRIDLVAKMDLGRKKTNFRKLICLEIVFLKIVNLLYLISIIFHVKNVEIKVFFGIRLTLFYMKIIN